MTPTVIVAAMEREVQPLVRAWKRCSISDAERSFVAFESNGRAVVISGIGCKNAAWAAKASMARYRPSMLMSVGLAGAVIRSLKAGSVVTPNVVVDAADGTEYRCAAGQGGVVGGGVLVTANAISGAAAKAKLGEQFHALIVDMEAAGVARVAQETQIGFRCVKAISDEADFVMPPMAQFVDAAGSFQTGKFAAWAAVRPWQWTRVAALGRNSRRAVHALCAWLEKDVPGDVTRAEVVTLNKAEFPNVVPEGKS
jgi:adenosylhomocysteine nucleosidase